jgi:hypothetical protein
MLTGVGQVDPCHLRQDGRIYAGDLFGQPEVVRQDEVAGHRARRSGVAPCRAREGVGWCQ